MSRTYTTFCLLLSIALFALSLALPAFSSSSGGHYPGAQALVVGMVEAILGFFMTLVHPSSFGESVPLLSWFANPLLLLAWIGIVASKPPLARITSVLALVFWALFLAARSIPTGSTSLEGIRTGIGYWVWFASILVALVASFGVEQEQPAPKGRTERERWNPH
ncbi:MAG: hypothetical protein ACJ8GW_20710 [Massilia sp.]